MSAEAVTVVLHHSKAQGAAKLILWGIANHHSDQGAWPSIATLAKYAGITERRVQQIVRELTNSGEITIQEQGGFGHTQYKTNRYFINLTCPPDCDGTLQHRTGVKSVTVRGEISDIRGEIWSPSGVKPISPEPNKEPIKKPNKNLSEYFAEFWNVYPRKLDKGKAERAFKSAIKKASPEEIIQAAQRYRDDPTRRDDFTKYPATWLNAESWNNEPDHRTKALEEWLNE